MADFNSSLPIRTELNGDAVAGIAKVDNTRIDPATEQKQNNIISNQTDGSQKTQVVKGGNIWDIDANGAGLIRGSATNPVPVSVVDSVAGDEKHIFGTTVAGVPNTPSTLVNYTVTAGKTFLLKQIQGAGSGKLKIEVKTGPTGSETLKSVSFTSTSKPSDELTFGAPIEVAAGDKILLIITNKDVANQDLYGFINGIEV